MNVFLIAFFVIHTSHAVESTKNPELAPFKIQRILAQEAKNPELAPFKIQRTLAQEAKKAQWAKLKKELKNRRSALTSPVVQKRLERIYRVLNNKNSEDKAIKMITNLEKIVKKKPFELARLYNLKAQLYLSKDDFKKATLYYDKALGLKKLSHREHLSVLYDKAVLFLLQNKIKKASQLVEQLFYLADDLSPSAYVLKATLLIEQKKKKQALKLIMKAINSSASPKESWLAMAVGLNIERENYIPAVKLLKQLTALAPEEAKYWKQLSAVYLNINKDDRALAVLDLAYKLQFLEKEKEILHLASLLMYQGLPYKAGQLLEQALKLKKLKPTQKNYEILGDCWIRAQETKKALQAYQISAPLAKDGKVFAKMGRIDMRHQKWKSAGHRFIKALEKGGIKRPEHIYISAGIAYLYLKQYTKAVSFFEQVIDTKAKGDKIKIARQWINYTNSLKQERDL